MSGSNSCLRVTEKALERAIRSRIRRRAAGRYLRGDRRGSDAQSFYRRARICRSRRGPETARRAADPELRQARERPEIESRE